jgi:membrane protein DedA with SNARE-associated domain
VQNRRMSVLAAVAVSHPLPGFLQSVAGPIDNYGYWAIALLLLLENIGVPVVPGELALIASAVFAGTGRAGLNVVAVGVVAVACCFTGAEIGYCIGRFGGRALALRYGKYVLVREHHLDRAESAVASYGGAFVIIARFIIGLRELNGIIAGVTGLRWQRFAFYNAIGAAGWVAVWVSLGYLAGDHIGAIYSDASRYSLYVLIALVVLLAAYIALRLWRRAKRADHRAGEPAEKADSRPGR